MNQEFNKLIYSGHKKKYGLPTKSECHIKSWLLK